MCVCLGVQNSAIYGFRSLDSLVYALPGPALLIIPTLALALCNEGQLVPQVVLAHRR